MGNDDVTTATVATAAAAAAEAAWRSQRRVYRDLRQRKRLAFWSTAVEADRHSPRDLWRTVDRLLGRGRPPISTAVSVQEFSDYFANKVANVRSSTADAPEPSFVQVAGHSLTAFADIAVDDVINVIKQLPDKSSDADPLPVPVMKQLADVLAPFLWALYNRSMTTGHFPAVYKQAIITPLLKKPDLDPTDAGSFRPISNLSVVSKLLERLVSRQLLNYVQSSGLLPTYQSAYRPGHSTETAVLRVLSDILLAVDQGEVTVLVLLDLSAAFDTVDHATLLRRLEQSFALAARFSSGSGLTYAVGLSMFAEVPRSLPKHN